MDETDLEIGTQVRVKDSLTTKSAGEIGIVRKIKYQKDLDTYTVKVEFADGGRERFPLGDLDTLASLGRRSAQMVVFRKRAEDRVKALETEKRQRDLRMIRSGYIPVQVLRAMIMESPIIETLVNDSFSSRPAQRIKLVLVSSGQESAEFLNAIRQVLV